MVGLSITNTVTFYAPVCFVVDFLVLSSLESVSLAWRSWKDSLNKGKGNEDSIKATAKELLRLTAAAKDLTAPFLSINLAMSMVICVASDFWLVTIAVRIPNINGMEGTVALYDFALGLLHFSRYERQLIKLGSATLSSAF